MDAPRARIALAAALASLVLTPAAFARQDAGEPEMNLRGVSIMAEPLPALDLPDLSAPAAFDGVIEARLGEPASSVDRSGDNVSASALPWYEQFTAAAPADLAAAWGEQASEFRFTAGERWGFTLGFNEADEGPQFQIEDVSAGAFFAINDRFRLGGQVRFTSPGQDVFGEAADDHAPELKFESAFRF